MSVPQFTTPTFTLTFSDDGLDLTEARNVYVTFQSYRNSLTKTGPDLTIEEKSIGVHLSQDETALFERGDVKIQANWTTPGGGRAASEVVTYNISEQLLRKVVE